jgi:hypothetical protein
MTNNISNKYHAHINIIRYNTHCIITSISNSKSSSNMRGRNKAATASGTSTHYSRHEIARVEVSPSTRSNDACCEDLAHDVITSRGLEKRTTVVPVISKCAGTSVQ